MSSRVHIHTPAEVAEVSRALQVANRRRMEERQADGWAERDALRLAQQARALVDNPASRAAKNDPWRGAIPEFEPIPEVRQRLAGKRFEVAGAYFQYTAADKRLRISTADRQLTREIQLSSSPLWHEVFPVGGDRVIIVFYGNGVSVDYSDTPGDIVYTNCQPAGCWEALNAANDSGWLADHLAEPGVNTITLLDKQECNVASTPGFRIVSSYAIVPWFYTVTVNKASIQVAEGWPQQFKSVIEQKYTVATGAGQIVDTGPEKFSITGREQFLYYQINYVDGRPPLAVTFNWLITETSVSAGYDKDVEPITSPNAYQRPTLLQFSSAGGPDITAEWVHHPLMRCYGYGYLVNRGKDGQVQGWGWTPAVFSFIKNYKGEFHKENGDRTMLTNGMSYQYARDNYFPADTPAYFLTADVAMPQAKEDTTHNYYYFLSPTIDGSVYFDDPMAFRNDGATATDLALRLNRPPYATEVVRQTFDQAQKEIEQLEVGYFRGQEIPIAAWDWDRPLACQIELSRLGFSTADMMLSQAEADALAQADWDEIGFKF